MTPPSGDGTGDRSTTSLSARSIVASTLLGTHPPRLPGRLLVALATEFGVPPGTTRVALSRMVERGELINDDGTYELTGALTERLERQERGRQPRKRPWDGSWELWILRPDGGPAERDEAARAAAALGLAERRDGVWMRPDNLDPARLAASQRALDAVAERFVAHPASDPALLAAELWDLPAWAQRASELDGRMSEVVARLEADDRAALAPGFELSAAVLRHLVHDPQLPTELQADGWPAAELTASFDRYDRIYRQVLRAFFAEHR